MKGLNSTIYLSSQSWAHYVKTHLLYIIVCFHFSSKVRYYTSFCSTVSALWYFIVRRCLAQGTEGRQLCLYGARLCPFAGSTNIHIRAVCWVPSVHGCGFSQVSRVALTNLWGPSLPRRGHFYP